LPDLKTWLGNAGSSVLFLALREELLAIVENYIPRVTIWKFTGTAQTKLFIVTAKTLSFLGSIPRR